MSERDEWPKSFHWCYDRTDILTFFNDSGENQATTKGDHRYFNYVTDCRGSWVPCETPADHVRLYEAWKSPAVQACDPLPALRTFVTDIDAAFRLTSGKDIQLAYQAARDRLRAAETNAKENADV